ncbi:YaaC family protein [Salinicola sp. CR57]|uniref:YaaC family protein n=1 Tax=Salinicola sp. CR57 TaxID=1949086 RepID=UPI000DA21606|nr:YaaC family protein [Salinicola sp. CR57]
MLDNLLSGLIEITEAENNSPFKNDGAYEAIATKKQDLVEKWKVFSKEERRENGGDLKKYFRKEGLNEANDSDLNSSKNYYLLKKEINARLAADDPSRLLPINDLHFEQAILELVENMENTEHVRELYKIRKRAVGDSRNAGISASEASRVRNCMRQGRELYLAGKTGSLMVKPLNFFYSLTAYAYAFIILNNPIRTSLDSLPGSHGLNYIPDGMKSQVGGDMPQGTFSDLLCAFPTLNVRNAEFSIQQDASQSLLEFFKKRHTIGVGTLLSMVPEIREYYRITTGEIGRTHPLSVSMGKNDRNIVWEFQVGDGERRPSLSDVECSFEGFPVSERFGKYIVSVPASDAFKISASISCDARGNLWYIENPFHPVVFPEICIHFMLTSTLSNLMRYSPDHWGSVLLNETNSDQSLITRKYLSAFENKLPILILRSISKYFPYVIES